MKRIAILAIVVLISVAGFSVATAQIPTTVRNVAT
jgi:hypothetical protein